MMFNHLRKLLILTGLVLLYVSSITCCPTCIGRLEKNSPPFFSDSYDFHADPIDQDVTETASPEVTDE